ncbi:MAG: peptide-methionine (R)-S-oxide reductase MsrB, partial [bacterium]|nr:peptide-methionine (R)-S-oxide reductase MsrB [bacterium]
MGKMPQTEEGWRKRLTPEQYRILRERGTEPPFSGRYVQEKADGMYHCAGCGTVLFDADTKFESGTGWPSFTEPAVAETVRLRPDDSHGMVRTEVVCARCGGHLGHVFDDGPAARGGQHYCINSAALELKKR